MLVVHRAQKTPIRLTLVQIINDQSFGNHEMTFPPDFLAPPHLASANSFGSHTIGPDTSQYLTVPAIFNNNAFGFHTVALGTPHTLVMPHLTNAQSFPNKTIGPPPGIIDALLVSAKYLKVNNSDYLRIQE
jgi:hypothetical protein